MDGDSRHPRQPLESLEQVQGLKKFHCNVCFRKTRGLIKSMLVQKGLMMVECGCFYCESCYLDSCTPFNKSHPLL